MLDAILGIVLVCARGQASVEATHEWNAVAGVSGVVLMQGCEPVKGWEGPVFVTSLDYDRANDPHFSSLNCPDGAGCTDGKTYAWCGNTVKWTDKVHSCAHEIGHMLGLVHPSDGDMFLHDTVMGAIGYKARQPSLSDALNLRLTFKTRERVG